MSPVPGIPTVTPDKVYRLSPDRSIVFSSKDIRWRRVRMVATGMLAVLTLCLTVLVTLVFPARIGNSSEVLWTQRAPLATGVPHAGQYVVLSDELGGLRSNTRIFESLFREHSIVRIVAAPGDELTYQGEVVAVNGVRTNLQASIVSGERLSAQYLVFCEAGNCEREDAFTVPTPYVLGTVQYDPLQAEAERLQAEKEAAQRQARGE